MAPVDIPIDAAHLLGLCLGHIFFGLYTGIFGATLLMMSKRGFRNRVIWITLSSMYILTTGAAICDNMIAYEAFVKYRVSPGTIERLWLSYDPERMTRDALWVVCVFLSDGLLLWRLRMVWPMNNYIFLVVLLILLGSYAAMIATSYYDVAGAIYNDMALVAKMEVWAGATFGLILGTNLIMNGLIAGRLWWLGRQVNGATQGRSKRYYKRVIIAIVESGSLYSIFFIIMVTFYGLNLINLTLMMYYILPSVVGLVCTLMILRMNWNPTLDDEPTTIPETSPDVQWASPAAQNASTGVTSFMDSAFARFGNGVREKDSTFTIATKD